MQVKSSFQIHRVNFAVTHPRQGNLVFMTSLGVSSLIFIQALTCKYNIWWPASPLNKGDVLMQIIGHGATNSLLEGILELRYFTPLANFLWNLHPLHIDHKPCLLPSFSPVPSPAIKPLHQHCYPLPNWALAQHPSPQGIAHPSTKTDLTAQQIYCCILCTSSPITGSPQTNEMCVMSQLSAHGVPFLQHILDLEHTF